ncbi:di-heme oxidoreductase family protein [Mucilaginibacter segetis]|uniref:C-type cytochrome n=1 Tax=Mucilaginibacter segetis TaxID=2793071 RepID=A0A934PSQ6_9SPHI|nr:di-heme oxidoredictase family protein [Mucilaginibacter segetis]MBK0378506.1 c-type cytochrome [Mucilaginibacter segetis]
MKKTTIAILVILTAVIVVQFSCRKTDNIPASGNPDSEWLSGGSETAFDQGSGSFSHAFSSLSAHLLRVHEIGDGQFGATFVSAPAPVNPGLGPIFNNVSCSSCHVSDGRGKIPGIGESAANMLFRLSIPGVGEHGNPVPVPGYGDQLQTRSLLNVTREGDVNITYTDNTYYFADGEAYQLRTPAYALTGLYTTMPANVLLSPRVAAPVFGLGLLEAVSDASILASADPDDKDGDGISGKPNYVWDILNQKSVLGRFGWKANQPTLLQQVAAAYNGDIGITNFLFPKESSQGQTQFDSAPNSKSYELADSLLYSVQFYVRTLQVPVRRNVTAPMVVQGKALFIKAGCDKCHKLDLRTDVDVSFPSVSNQLIHPFTDLLLHDMGPGLADNRPDFLASGSEWRTAPLWGIGLTQKVNNHTNFLHDGRARNLMEAIMWHGGEALSSKVKVSHFTKTEREAILAYLNSL